MKKNSMHLAIFVVISVLVNSCLPVSEEQVNLEGHETMAPEILGTEIEKPLSYQQAPMLDDMNLPPVDKRLPVTPQVIKPVERIGQYGGTWTTVSWGDALQNIKMIFYDPPVRWNSDYSGYEAGLAKSWTFNEDGTQLTYHLREGLKWSDGVPYTTADWAFWWHDMAMNDAYSASQVPAWARNQDETPISITFPDDHTVVMTWDSPNWIAPYILAQGFQAWESLMKPAHFLKQYHPEYDGRDYDELWMMDKWWETPGYPVLFAWYCEEVIPGESTKFVRNPYYWKVDTEGNQLPYIDHIVVEIQQDEEVRVLKLSQGQYDASFRGTADPKNIPFLSEQAEAYGYHLQGGWMNGAGAWPGWLINQDYVGEECGDPPGSVPAEECRDLLRDTNFRKGLSVALDRERILDVVWDGTGIITQATISPQSWHFASDEGQTVYAAWKNADAQYNPELAADYFEAAGFMDADGDGWRDLPSGQPFVLMMDLNTWGGEQIRIQSDEIAKENWEAVGVKCIIINVQNHPENANRANYGLFMVRGAYISEIDIWTNPNWIFPIRGGGQGSHVFPMQGHWYASGGKEGIQPEEGSPAYLLQALYEKGINESDEEKRHEIVWEAISIIINEGPFIIGATGDQQAPVVIKDNFHNVPEYGILGPWSSGSPGNTHPEQYWIEQ